MSLFQAGLTRTQFLFDSNAIGDVASQQDKACVVSQALPFASDRKFKPAFSSRQVQRVSRSLVHAEGIRFFNGTVDDGGRIDRQHVAHPFPEKLCGLDEQPIDLRSAEIKNSAGRIDLEHQIRQGVQRSRQLSIRLPQRFLGLLAWRDVPRNSQQCDHAAAIVPQRTGMRI